MFIRTLLLVVSIVFAASQPAQAQEALFQTLNCIKVDRGKEAEWLQLSRETTQKVAEMRVNSGEIVSWTLLRNVMPAGASARCNFIVSVITKGAPPAPGQGRLEEVAAKAGVQMTAQEWRQKRTALGYLVSTEIWRIRELAGQYGKGHYLYLNYMKEREPAQYRTFEHEIWRPMADEWIKQGMQSGWVFATKVLPSGTDTDYTAYSADIYPNWETASAPRAAQPIFEKVHQGKNYQLTMVAGRLRDLAERTVFVIEERVAKN